ncbi:MAG: hypothetical protein HKN59_09320 [Gammaproteobacteria bacterium]|nr:hypothetical protein [Gammaproteobacteria bacterium]
MEVERIKVRATDSDAILDVTVYSKRVDCIEVMLGEGTHSVKCTLTPTPNGRAYSGTAMGREIVYERSPEQVQIELDRLNPGAFKPRRR